MFIVSKYLLPLFFLLSLVSCTESEEVLTCKYGQRFTYNSPFYGEGRCTIIDKFQGFGRIVIYADCRFKSGAYIKSMAFEQKDIGCGK